MTAYTAYVIIDTSTGEIAHTKAYTASGPAKLALRYHYEKSPQYAVAKITAVPSQVVALDADGNWAEVSADDVA
ncbi:hypothetical protein NST07_25810 [Paenibacillus sp. FSL L8-0340]|uniref:hypothetical protein n=1 Tax=Paenibacillus sp. FSL L8-0340 TaxID=2954685 RepID=UPI00315887B0